MKAGKLTAFLAFVLALPAVSLADGNCPATPTGVIPLDRRPAPALRLSDMDGRVTDVADLRGGWSLVHFWASWCGPCRRELPALAEVAPMLERLKLPLVLVNTAETEDEVFAFLPLVAPSLTTLMDRDGQVTERWQPRGLPATFFLDPKGRLAYVALGGRPWDKPAYRAFLEGLPRC